MFLGILYMVIVLLLLLTNGLLAMSELAVVSSSKTRLQSRAEEGDANARAALDLALNPNRFLATVQIGITLIGVLSGAFGGAGLAVRLAQPLSSLPYLGRFSESISMAVVVGFITYLSLLAELVPKRIAISVLKELRRRLQNPWPGLPLSDHPLSMCWVCRRTLCSAFLSSNRLSGRL